MAGGEDGAGPAPPGPVLAVDVGLRRTGVAVSDPLRLVPRPLDVIDVQDPETDADRIAGLAREHGATLVVVGLPLLPSGDEGDQAHSVHGFVAVLRERLSVPVELWDESYTTLEAARRRRLGPRRRRGHLDAQAAAVILEEWLREQDSSRAADADAVAPRGRGA